MRNNLLDKLFKSFKLRVFAIITLVIVVPAVIFGALTVWREKDTYMESRMEKFNSTNTRLKNTIINENYMEDQASEKVEYTLDEISSQYSCKIKIVNSVYTILYDTVADNVGKTIISEMVISALDGEECSYLDEENEYIEYAVPLSVSGSEGDSVIGVLYINYSLTDTYTYIESFRKYVFVAEILIILFALITGFLLSKFFSDPIERVNRSIKKILGKSPDEVELSDYTEISSINSDIADLVENINRQEQSRQEFVSNVSHELKTPITSMKILADSLIGQEGVPEEVYQEFLTDISKEIDRENEVIMDLLDLVKLEKTDLGLNITGTNINEIIENVLKRLKPLAGKKNIELIFESFRPVVADVDGIKFSSVVSNIVENAIKYNVNDGKVTVSLNSDHQYFFIRVTDTGIGISKDEQKHIFERFYRVDKARSRETGGTGLGLAITREIVLKHHGSIKIHSRVGEGTTFNIRIPLKFTETPILK